MILGRKTQFGPGLFRLVLASMVVISHLTKIEIGRLAVMGFFVLSGYWVSTAFIKNYGGTPAGIMRFYGARFFRIYPFYLVLLAVTQVVFVLTGDAHPIGLADITLFGLANVEALKATLRPAWSLDIELQFYLLVPLLLWIFQRYPAKWLKVATLVASAALGIVWLALLKPHHGLNLLTYGAPFLVGTFAALHPIKVRDSVAAWSAGAFVAVGLLLAAIPALRPFLFKGGADIVDRDIVALVWISLLTPFILWNVRVRSAGRDQMMGDLAFSLYLTHWMIAKRYHEMFGFLGSRTLMALAAVFAIIVGTALAYMLVDRPLESLRRRLFNSRVPPPPLGSA